MCIHKIIRARIHWKAEGKEVEQVHEYQYLGSEFIEKHKIEKKKWREELGKWRYHF